MEGEWRNIFLPLLGSVSEIHTDLMQIAGIVAFVTL